MSVTTKEPEARPIRAASRPTGKARRPGGALRHRLHRDRALLLMMVPGLLFFLVFQYLALFGNVIAFKDYMPFLGVAQSPWAGLSNFQTLFGEPAFWHAALNTVVLALAQLIFYFPVPLALALLLHSLIQGRVRRFVQSVVYLPHFISWVIVVALFQQVLGADGALNGVLGGSDGHLFDIFGNPDLFKPLMVLELIWKECGWGTIIFLAALAQVDNGLYEAAALDGAGPWRRFWHVTLPGLRSVIFLLLILRLGDILSVGFEQILLQRDAFGPDVAEVIDTYVFYHGIRDQNWGVAAAAALFKGVIGACLVFSANKIAHRMGEQGVYR
ncbi:ABC transporter permease subunit [Streptomyces sp. NPDC048641]|uniref:ABC transporter permease n=1 Tax=unclassified Streptomyces TaxID=2593676 RepID=UPI003443ABC6